MVQMFLGALRQFLVGFLFRLDVAVLRGHRIIITSVRVLIINKALAGE